MEFIPLCVPEIRGQEWTYVKDCFDTNWVSYLGPYTDKFEQKVADFVGAKHAVSAVSGTAAIHIALLVAGVKADEEVLLSAMTFIAPANAIRYIGAWPVFIDAEPNYWQMDPAKVKDFIEHECEKRDDNLYNKSTGRRVAAIMPVHILGHPVDMDPILDIAEEFNLPVIEDATEGLGGNYKGARVGNIGNIGCYSFNGNKLLTTGGGGMLSTNNTAWAKRAKHLTTQAKSDPIEYMHDEIGYNYRMTNVLAAIGCAQMEQIDSYISKKLDIAAKYKAELQSISGITVAPEAEWADSSFWLYTILVNPDLYGMTARELLMALHKHEIQSRPLWQPIHKSPAHEYAQRRDCPVADDLFLKGLSIPCSIGLTVENQERVIHTIRKLAKN